VLGGGFAGLAAALALAPARRVALVDRRAHFEFLPNIHELVSGVKTPALLRLPLRPILVRRGHRFVRGEIRRIDLAGRRVVLAGGRALAWDALVVALGGVNATHGVAGADEHALPFKSVDDCARIGRRLRALARGWRRGARPIDVVVVGGGLEGVEALGEILRRFRTRGCFRVQLVEARPRLLPEAPARLDRLVRDLAAPWNVDILTGEAVRAVRARSVALASGRRLPSEATIWTGGPAAPALLAEAGLSPAPGTWAPAEPTLESVEHPDVFLAGDAVRLPAPLAKQGYHALDMGRCAADNLVRRLEGRRLRRYRPAEKPTLVSFGDLDTFLVAGRVVAASPALAVAKEAVYELVMAQLDRENPARRVRGAQARLEQAVREVAWPALSSLAALRRQLRLRVSVR